MTELKVIIGGSEEERNPIMSCPICDVLPILEARLHDPMIHFFFTCPVCGESSAPACSLRTAKQNWNLGINCNKRNQSRMDDF